MYHLDFQINCFMLTPIIMTHCEKDVERLKISESQCGTLTLYYY